MKAVIIGSGIAGLSLATMLRNNGFEVSIHERETQIPVRGHAFLMHPDAMEVLNSLSVYLPEQEIPGEVIDKIVLKRPDNTVLQATELESWICMKRSDMIQYLNFFIPFVEIHYNNSFSHFIYDSDRVSAAIFDNGDIVYGDLFIGADGSKSMVRKALFGEMAFTPVEVKEIVGIVRQPELAAQLKNTFTKYMSETQGLAVGMIPCSKEEIVWFMQFDIRLQREVVKTPEKIKEFCQQQLKDFPAELQVMLEANDFSTNYIWHSTDFDLLPTFHKNNVALIGDAAHVALPFTSSGTTNALLDAQKMAELLLRHEDFEDAFKAFYSERSKHLKEHIELGRAIKKSFLATANDKITLPLIVQLQEGERKIAPKIEILYFTDPVCSTCWQVQPQLRKLALLYGEYFEINYRMGGLLPSWNNFNRGGIKNPIDAAEHWKEIALENQMSISPDVWLHSPLASSFPPSIAIKAAQLQHKIKAFRFHRRIKELIFIESKNIADIDLLISTAVEEGLDRDRLVEDMGKMALIRFEEDLKYASELDVQVLPTFIFTNELNEEVILRGYQEFDVLEKAILDLYPLAEKDRRKRKPLELFKIYHSMTTHEFAYLMEMDKTEGENILINLSHSGFLTHKKNQSGVIWKLNRSL